MKTSSIYTFHFASKAIKEKSRASIALLLRLKTPGTSKS